FQAGFDREAPAAFLLEYLEPEAVGLLLGKLQGVARPGSWLGADFPDTSFLASPSTKSFLEKFERLGCPWRFGTPDPEGFLAQYGWDAVVVMPGEPAAHYGRWPYPAASRTVPGVPRSYLVTARLVG